MTPPDVAPTAGPPSGLWRGRYISALGFSRTAYFALKFEGDANQGKVSGSYFTHLALQGDRVEGSVDGKYANGEMQLTASAPRTDKPGAPKGNFALTLTYLPSLPTAEGVVGRTSSAYGLVRGEGDSLPYSGVIRVRHMDGVRRIMANGWIDESPEE